MVMMGGRDIAWCPGCGDFGIRNALEAALKELPIPIGQIVFTSGIGQAAKLPQYLDVNYFNGLHGRALPVAAGIKIARPELTVIAVSGDGCNYGEGGNHFIHTIRKNLDLTILTCDNRVYALTKGQSAPTTDKGVINSLDPTGSRNTPLNPLALAIVMGAPFVARGFAGDIAHLKTLLKEAILFKGTSVIDILQPCVTFNKINTYQWYKDRVFTLEAPVQELNKALELAEMWGDRIPIGTIYKNESAEPRETGKILFQKSYPEKAIDKLLKMKHMSMR